MLEFLTLLEHAALYLSLPVLCIWSLLRGSPETKFAIWGIMSEHYVASYMKHALHVPEGSPVTEVYSLCVEFVTAMVVIRSGKSVFLLIFEGCIILSWVATGFAKFGLFGSFWSAMTAGEFFMWVGNSCFALALLSDDRFPNAHWREVLSLARFWR